MVDIIHIRKSHTFIFSITENIAIFDFKVIIIDIHSKGKIRNR